MSLSRLRQTSLEGYIILDRMQHGEISFDLHAKQPEASDADGDRNLAIQSILQGHYLPVTYVEERLVKSGEEPYLFFNNRTLFEALDDYVNNGFRPELNDGLEEISGLPFEETPRPHQRRVLGYRFDFNVFSLLQSHQDYPGWITRLRKLAYLA